MKKMEGKKLKEINQRKQNEKRKDNSIFIIRKF
jgi:hypothetical protein